MGKERKWLPSVEEPEPERIHFPEDLTAHTEGLWNLLLRVGLLLFNIVLVLGLLLFLYFYLNG